ncbi:uncharacterized protein LOC135349149 [Halichondria panicea]|uniref:uncharacterized protein LOC135349149 n=1 Tax=Halichondria panicea TaxID=6063 RepID=UPI00312B5D7A
MFHKAQYSVSVDRPCPMETVTFTCTANGDILIWDLPGNRITVLTTSDPLVMQSGYTVTLIAFDNDTLTSTLSRTAENGITVSCSEIVSTLTTIGSSTIRLVDPPGPPSAVRHFILSSSVNEVSVSVQWNPPTETGGRDDPTYTVTISPPAQLFATVLTSTSVTVTAQYNVDYTVSVVATNCAGNSTTADYNFRIGGCPALTNLTNGAFGPVFSRLPGSTVTIQCDAGYVSVVAMVTCEGTLMWSPDPEAIECTSLITPTPTTPPPINCTAPLSPPLEPPTAAPCNCNCASLSDGSRFDAAVSISVVVTAIVFMIIGLFVGLLIMYLFMHKKNVYSPSPKERANVGPTVPAGPVYEEVSPKEEIELNTNQAYGPVGL